MADHGKVAADEISRLSLRQDRGHPPLRSSFQHAGIVAVDITEKFAAAGATLQPGELVQDETFTLLESVSALEIMDPKMDSGLLEPGEDVEIPYDVSQPLEPEQVLGIIDQLICHEMSWHLGYPLSQTLFTSIYVDALLVSEPWTLEQACFVRNSRPERNQQPMLQILRAYCLGMLKACNLVIERIRSQTFFEEEDFVPSTYNRDLLTNIPCTDIQRLLADAVGLVESLAGESISEAVADGLTSRLGLRSVFLTAAKTHVLIKDPAAARKSWDEALEMLPRLSATHGLATAVDEAFSVKLQRRLTSTLPPRPVVQLDFAAAFSHLTRLFEDGSEAISVMEHHDPQCLQTFVQTFVAKTPQPMVFVRALLQTLLFQNKGAVGAMSIRDVLDDDLSTVSLHSSILLDRSNDDIEAVHDPRFAVSKQMSEFRERAAVPFLDMLRTSCQNRCRARRTLCHLIADWEFLQSDVEKMDEVIRAKAEALALQRPSIQGLDLFKDYPLHLSSWAYLYKLQQMERIVQLGFELQLYQADEMAGMYWYLHFLAKTREQHLERIGGFIHRAPRPAHPPEQRRMHRSLNHTRLQLLDAAVTWALSDALCCVYTVLLRNNLIPSPPRPYSNAELRYQLRMKPFAAVCLPDLPTYNEFHDGTTQPNCSTGQLLDYAQRAVASAKKGLESLSKLDDAQSFSVGSYPRWVESANGALRACIATMVAISELQKALPEAEDGARISVRVPPPEEAYHVWWIVPKITVSRG